MRAANNWRDYEIIDTSSGEKLERWGNQYFVRPDPQVIWDTPKDLILWNKANAKYHRSNSGGGSWEFLNPIKSSQNIAYNKLKFKVEPTGFKHMGLFPEQAVNWDFVNELIKKQNRSINVLNLFAYTGGATLACADYGANVCHVDASKGMVAWAKENAALSGLSDKPIRWIVDDCEKFVSREIRRNRLYDAVIMDPPSYGRGPGGEIWKLEDKIYNLLKLCSNVLSEKPLLFLLNSYTTGLSPSVMQYLLGVTVGNKFNNISADEIGLPVTRTKMILPCGSTAIALNK